MRNRARMSIAAGLLALVVPMCADIAFAAARFPISESDHVPPSGAVPSPAPTSAAATVTAWVRVATEGEAFDIAGAQKLRYGDGLRWATRAPGEPAICAATFFGADPAYGIEKFCEAQITVPAVTQIKGAMPVINTALIPKPARPFSGPRVMTLNPDQLANGVFRPAPTDVGAFRISCAYSHISNDDPIVFPNKPGAAHLHTFSGNAGANAASTADSLATTGGSTCAGGTLNRTAYWMPTLIDVRNGQPVVPTSTNFYYKLGYYGVKAAEVRPFPKGLRMIAGDATNTSPIRDPHLGLECVSGGGHRPAIPSCPVGDDLNVSVLFPQCWDGVNLDSPDHHSHMAYGTGRGCPATHPVALPEIALNVHYKVAESNSGAFWKLSSDNYAGPGGYSLHADWFGAWDDETMRSWIKNCINNQLDCHNHLLGDGRTLY